MIPEESFPSKYEKNTAKQRQRPRVSSTDAKEEKKHQKSVTTKDVITKQRKTKTHTAAKEEKTARREVSIEKDAARRFANFPERKQEDRIQKQQQAWKDKVDKFQRQLDKAHHEVGISQAKVEDVKHSRRVYNTQVLVDMAQDRKSSVWDIMAELVHHVDILTVPPAAGGSEILRAAHLESIFTSTNQYGSGETVEPWITNESVSVLAPVESERDEHSALGQLPKRLSRLQITRQEFIRRLPSDSRLQRMVFELFALFIHENPRIDEWKLQFPIDCVHVHDAHHHYRPAVQQAWISAAESVPSLPKLLASEFFRTLDNLSALFLFDEDDMKLHFVEQEQQYVPEYYDASIAQPPVLQTTATMSIRAPVPWSASRSTAKSEAKGSAQKRITDVQPSQQGDVESIRRFGCLLEAFYKSDGQQGAMKCVLVDDLSWVEAYVDLSDEAFDYDLPDGYQAIGVDGIAEAGEMFVFRADDGDLFAEDAAERVWTVKQISVDGKVLIDTVSSPVVSRGKPVSEEKHRSDRQPISLDITMTSPAFQRRVLVRPLIHTGAASTLTASSAVSPRKQKGIQHTRRVLGLEEEEEEVVLGSPRSTKSLPKTTRVDKQAKTITSSGSWGEEKQTVRALFTKDSPRMRWAWSELRRMLWDDIYRWRVAPQDTARREAMEESIVMIPRRYRRVGSFPTYGVTFPPGILLPILWAKTIPYFAAQLNLPFPHDPGYLDARSENVQARLAQDVEKQEGYKRKSGIRYHHARLRVVNGNEHIRFLLQVNPSWIVPDAWDVIAEFLFWHYIGGTLDSVDRARFDDLDHVEPLPAEGKERLFNWQRLSNLSPYWADREFMQALSIQSSRKPIFLDRHRSAENMLQVYTICDELSLLALKDLVCLWCAGFTTDTSCHKLFLARMHGHVPFTDTEQMSCARPTDDVPAGSTVEEEEEEDEEHKSEVEHEQEAAYMYSESEESE